MLSNDTKPVYKAGNVSLHEITTPRGKRVLLDLGCDAVLIIPRTRERKYILTVQKRPGTNSHVYEFPSGGIKSGETSHEAAARELLEETGARGKLSFITKVEPLSGVVRFTLSIFLAEVEEVAETDKALEPHEEVGTVTLSMDELMNAVQHMEAIDGYILLGLGALYLEK